MPDDLMSSSSQLSADKLRRPRFRIADDSDDDEDDTGTNFPDESGPPPPLQSALNGHGSRDSEGHERHVGFAAAPVFNDGRDPGPGQAASPLAEKDKRDGGADLEKQSPPSSSSKDSYPPTGRKAFDGPEFATKSPPEPPSKKSRLPPLPGFMAWIPPNMNWKGFRPVVRSSIAAWCGLLLSACPDCSLSSSGFIADVPV